VTNVIPFRREPPRRRLLHVADAPPAPTPIRARVAEPEPEPEPDLPPLGDWARAVYAAKWGDYPGPSPLARRGDGGRYRPLRQRPEAESEGGDDD
jgi:hypothetical protein